MRHPQPPLTRQEAAERIWRGVRVLLKFADRADQEEQQNADGRAPAAKQKGAPAEIARQS